MDEIRHPHDQVHKSDRAPWLRAAVLGANDGIVSTASLMVGVAAATDNATAILTAGIAGLTAGALSMAAGEYVSVSSQRDTEKADIEIERQALKELPAEELEQLTQIYEARGLDRSLAEKVAQQLTERDALRAHMREELHIDIDELARPWQAAFASMGAFIMGGIVPVVTALLVHGDAALSAIVISALVTLALIGTAAAFVGGARKLAGALRVFVGGGLAMLITWGIGSLVGLAI